MSELIGDPRYWARRLREAKELHHAVFKCPLDRWQRIEAKHRQILQRHILSADRILDCGCGWGRLLSLMPIDWRGFYCGVDISPDFICKAIDENKQHCFAIASLDHMPFLLPGFDWAIMISVRPMIKRHMGEEAWARMEQEIRRVAKRLLYLEYDEQDEGSVE